MSTTLPYQESLRAPVQDTGHSSTVSSLQGKAPDSDSHQIPPPSSSVIVYSPRQILLLYASPLVKPPIGIPALKDWFGSENELCASKEAELSGPGQNHTRERRTFRRDAEEREALIRPSIRGNHNQHAQMGHFKHQSIRGNESFRSKDVEKEKTPKEKDKVEERVSLVADQSVRERLVVFPNRSAPGQARNNDGDITHGYAIKSMSKDENQHTAHSRKSDAKSSSMKVVVDSNEEWRRCIESSTRCSRDHRHDKHDIPGLDLLKQGPPSLSRDTDIVDSFLERRPERRRNIRSVPDGDHDGHDAFRRDIDCGGASGVTENRRWKDDGKRDERNVIRRERQLCGRERDSEQRSGNGHVRKVNYDHSLDKCHDRPGKHNSGRDKIGDGLIDDETFGRGNYGRERNVEKQPAWMDSSVTSVIGASGPADISDEIQSNQPPVTEKPLDEIQLFRLMMKQEEEKTNSENLKAATPVGAVRTSENERSARGSLSSGAQASHSDSSHISLTSGVPPRTTDFFLDSWKDGSRALSSIVSPSASSVISSGASSNAKVPENLARDESTISRFFPNPLSSENLHSRISYNQRPEDVRDRDADACYPHDHLRSESAVFDFRLSHQLDPQDPAQEIHIQHSLSRPSQDSATALPYDNLSRPLQVPVFDGIGSCEWDLRAEESVGDMKIGLSSDIASFGQRDFSSSPGLAVAKGSRFAKFFDSKGRLKDRLSPVAREQDGWAPLEYVAAGNAHASADENAEGMLATLTRSTQAHSAITEYASDATNNLQRFLNDQHATDNDRTFVPSRNQNGRMVVVESRRDEHVANSPRQFLPLSSYDHIYSSPAPPLGGQSGRCSRSGFQPGPLRNNYTHSPNHGSTKYFVPLAVPGGRSPHLVTESTGFPGMHSGVAPGYPRNTQYTNDIFPQPELYFTSGGVNPSTRISQSGVQHVQASLLNGTNAASDLVHGSPQSAQVVFSQQVNQAQVPMYGMRQHQRLPPHIIPTHLSYQGSSNQSSQDLMALLMGRPSRTDT